jgi:outer membrane murein-binding lipoprotein Lpp
MPNGSIFPDATEVDTMPSIHVTGQSHTQQANGSAEVERLAAAVRELQNECNRLRLALTAAAAERDSYRQSLYETARAAREFEDVDIPSLEAISAGPVEMI